MVTYNPKDWFTLIIQFHKSDTFRRLFWSLVSIGLYAAAIVYFEVNFIHCSLILGGYKIVFKFKDALIHYL